MGAVWFCSKTPSKVYTWHIVGVSWAETIAVFFLKLLVKCLDIVLYKWQLLFL